MAQRPHRVGIVGADAKASWAKVSHIPAIQGLENLELTAVATRNPESASEAAGEFGAQRWFSDPLAMIRDEAIDIVTIAVKVPDHHDLVMAALAAGKAVYCEAPLGRSVSETAALASAAGSGHVAIGLQSRLNPSARRAAELIAAGAIGTPLSARVVSTSSGFGAVTATPYLYFEQTDSGANLLTITAGHTLDLVEAVLGDIIEVDARAEIRWPNLHVIDTGGSAIRENADHLDVLGKTSTGAVVTASVLGGVAPQDGRFELEIRGSDGWLKLSGGHPYGFQAGDLMLTSSAEFTAPDEPCVRGGLMDAALNVAEVYASLVRDIEHDTRDTPGFDHALHNARLIDFVAKASTTGARQTLRVG